jgi:trehalose-6-phosphate synthase
MQPLNMSIDRSEIDEQAKQIRSKLRSLKKDTEYAKKLILNEKKLDHLLGVLDKSRDHIVKKSLTAYDDN